MWSYAIYAALVLGAYVAMLRLTHQPAGYGALAVIALLVLGWKTRGARRAEQAKQAQRGSHERRTEQSRQILLDHLGADLRALQERRRSS